MEEYFVSKDFDIKVKEIVRQLEQEVGLDELKRLASESKKPLEITVSIKGVEESGSYEV